MAPYKRRIVTACVAFVPVQLALLIFGEPHGLTDQVRVIGTLLQWALIAWAFYPGADYRQVSRRAVSPVARASWVA